MKALECKSHKLKLTQDEIAFVVINELQSQSKFLCMEADTHLACDLRIILPDSSRELVLWNTQWLHEITAAQVNFNLFTSRGKQNLRKGPDSGTPLL